MYEGLSLNFINLSTLKKLILLIGLFLCCFAFSGYILASYLSKLFKQIK